MQTVRSKRLYLFIFLRQRCPGQREYSFQIKAYYEKLPQKELDKNPNLYPNNPEY